MEAQGITINIELNCLGLVMDERRSVARSRCLVGAQVIFNNRKASLSCVARNITADGCMLVFGEDPFMPNRIDVVIDNRKGMVPAEVVWRDGRKVGIAFRNAEAERPRSESASVRL